MTTFLQVSANGLTIVMWRDGLSGACLLSRLFSLYGMLSLHIIPSGSNKSKFS